MRGTTDKSAGEEPVDSPQNSKSLQEQIKQMLDAEKNSTSTFYHKPSVRNGCRREKGDSPFVYNSILKSRKRKKQSNFTNPDPFG